MTASPFIALVGCGYWGKNLLRNFYEIGALYSICDPRKEVVEGFCEQYSGVKGTTRFEEVLEDSQVKAVVIAAPAHLHAELTEKALLKGKDVFVEKPLCLHAEEGKKLTRLAKERGKILMVGHLLHYHPCVEKMFDLVAQGEIGEVKYLSSHRLNLGKIRTEENVLWSFAPHDISVLIALCGGELPEKVACKGSEITSEGISDIALTTLQFPSGATGHIFSSWMHPFKEQKLVVAGTQGMILFDDRSPWEEKLKIFKEPVDFSSGIPVAKTMEGDAVAVAQGEPLKRECQHFIKCVLERKEPKTNGDEGLRVLRVLEEAQKSLSNGGDPILLSAKSDYFVHPTAVIDPGASLSEGVKVWHFSHIMEGAFLGKRCNIGQNVVVSPDVILGENVKVQNNVSIYSGVICEDDVFLGPSMVFTNVKNPRSAVNRRGEYMETRVEKGATIGANATIVCGCSLGKYAFIGAGGVVTKSVKPYALVVGNPAKQVGWMSERGHRLDLPLKAPEEEEIKAVCPEDGKEYVLRGEYLYASEALSKRTVSV